MRLLEFQPDGATVWVRTFSPSTGAIRTSALEDFSVSLGEAPAEGPDGDGKIRNLALRIPIFMAQPRCPEHGTGTPLPEPGRCSAPPRREP